MDRGSAVHISHSVTFHMLAYGNVIGRRETHSNVCIYVYVR